MSRREPGLSTAATVFALSVGAGMLAGALGRLPPKGPPDSAPGRTARRSQFGRYQVAGRTVTIAAPRAQIYRMWRDPASLAGFIRWFDSGDGDLKREAGASEGLVRVMTVHGSKGLQAPIVILADAAGNPDTSRASDLELADGTRTMPVPPTRKEERVGPLAEAESCAAKADRLID